MALAQLAPLCRSHVLGGTAMSSAYYSPFMLQCSNGVATDSSNSQLNASNLVRFKGYSRKLVLRAINRGLIARLAKRATIYIPCFGLYLACKIFNKDAKQAMDPTLDAKNRTLMAVAAGADALDVGAQTIIIAGILQNIAPVLLPATILAMQPNTALATADHVSLACALISCSAATWSLLSREEFHPHHH